MDPERIERLIDQGRDSYEARLAAGQARLKRGEIAQAVDHLLRATEQDEGKTIAWQSLGEAYRSRGQIDEARAAWKRGIEVAAANGDSQAEKVMTVWLKRLDKLPSLLDPKAVFSEDRLIGLPTETVYGLAAPIDRPDLIARVFELKGRPADHPLIVHVGSIEQARDCAADWPDAADQLAQSFWPGPLTLVLPKSETIDAAITAGQDTVALRMPDHPLALTVLRAAGVPFVAPSANLFTQLSPTRAEDVASAFSSDDVRVVDGGPCQVGIESTILALDAEQRVARVLRPGMVTPAELQSALPIDWSIDQRDETSTRAPGQMAVHYRPAQALRVEVLADASALEDRLQSLQSSGAAVLTLPDSASEAARLLYRLLREPEAATSDELILLLRQAQIDDPAWQGIVNRLTKAASRWIGASS